MASTRTRIAAQIVLPEGAYHVGFIGFMDNGKFTVHDQATLTTTSGNLNRSSDWLIPSKHHAM